METSNGGTIWDVLIIGGGPAGLAAALYSARAMRSTLVLERGLPGGQIATTSEVEDYPGIEMTTGPELSLMMMRHAQKFGAEVSIGDEVVEVNFNASPKEVRTSEGKTIRGKAVIIATGSAPRTLGVPGENALRGRGVSYCAVCDGPFFRDGNVAVVGGGDAAFDEGLYLTKYASKVTIIHRREDFRAQKLLIDRAKYNAKIEFLTSTIVEKVNGEGGVESVKVRNLKTDEVCELPLGGLFIYVGNIPNTGIFGDGIQVDENGFIQVDETMATGCPGVYAAGDVRKNPLKQVVTAAADGSIAALAADKYLDSLEADMGPVHAEQDGERAETWETAH